ncbi:hypothetical protein B7494_g6792 [Chlorociboria aeruginascens]|nr:hypothetical protein B7494_g6792 [Chlorociboria aeruginascens]
MEPPDTKAIVYDADTTVSGRKREKEGTRWEPEPALTAEAVIPSIDVRGDLLVYLCENYCGVLIDSQGQEENEQESDSFERWTVWNFAIGVPEILSPSAALERDFEGYQNYLAHLDECGRRFADFNLMRQQVHNSEIKTFDLAPYPRLGAPVTSRTFLSTKMAEQRSWHDTIQAYETYVQRVGTENDGKSFSNMRETAGLLPTEGSSTASPGTSGFPGDYQDCTTGDGGADQDVADPPQGGREPGR